MPLALACALGYALGSIPFAWLVVRIGFGKDLREYGSKNVGATNASRVAAQGRRGIAIGLFAAVFLLDVAKGLGAVAGAGWIGAGAVPVLVGGALGAILGHAFPVWLKFRGGKSVATSLGVFGWLVPWPTLCAAGVFAVILVATRFVSAGSIAAAVALPAAHMLLDPSAAFGDGLPVTILCTGVGAFVVYKHRGNIARLLAGTEGRIGDPPEPAEVSKA